MNQRLTLIIGISTICIFNISAVAKRPCNIVYIMSDELAYYEVGYMGNSLLKTPRIDQMASEGLIFTQALAGSPVCAPLRCNLMTGKHAGRSSVRANDGGTPLVEGEETIASMLKALGYATGGYGKWGAGGRGSTGVPEKHGFDDFFGYYDQVHAHSFYPAYLIRNSEEVALPGNVGGREGETYSHYEIMKEGLNFIRKNKDKPFFAYFPITPPHGMYDIPDSDPAWKHYRDKDWPSEAKNYAAMVTMVDNNVGTILDLLRELELEENTIVFFSGDNGGADRFKDKEHPRGFFGPNVNPKTGVEFRGGKGNLYEGGLRIPFVVRWPGKITAGRVSDLIWSQPDVLPTLAELTGAETPKGVTGKSILPELLGEKETGRKQEDHEFLYWEYGNQTAVRMSDWKAIRTKPDASWELYDLAKDLSEATNVADQHPKLVEKMARHAAESHSPVVTGTYSDRTLHEKDRNAKWGTSRINASGFPAPENQLSKKGRINPQSFRLVSVSSEAKGKPARYVFDDDPRTHWHSAFGDGVDPFPHEIVLDLGDDYMVNGFQILARQDKGFNGAVKECEFFVSADPQNFGEPVARGDLEKLKSVQSVQCDPVKGRFVKLKVISGHSPKSWASLSELGINGKL